MTQFDSYQFVLCLIVFTLLTGLFTTLTVWLIKLYNKLISSGVNDEKIKADYIKSQAKKPSVIGKIIDKLLLAICCAILLVMFGFALSVTLNEGKVVSGAPAMNVVKSNSMSYVNENHGRLNPGDVDNQIQRFDLVFINKLPSEENLQINDIVVYETDGILIIHRIVAIEEPNSKHPNERYFLLQGDANETSDMFPVRYKQMKGIYKGHRIPFIGSFVMFMQSPAGYLCVLLIFFAVIATAVAEKKIKQEIDKRLVALKLIASNEESANEESIQSTDCEDVTSEESAATLCKENSDVLDESKDESIFSRFGEGKTFAEKLEDATEPLASRYKEITEFICRIKNVRAIRGKKSETYRCGNNGICKLVIRGKTLNAYLALDPTDFENTKYIYEDVSLKASYKNYAMRVRVSSDRMVKWTKELITLLTKNNDFELAESDNSADGASEIAATLPDENNSESIFSRFGKGKTFAEKLEDATEPLISRYKEITEFICRIKNVRAIRGKKSETYRCGNYGVCKLVIRGKTLNVYLALDPTDFENTKYIYEDVSLKASYKNYAMRVRVSSDRMVKWTKELITLLAKNKNMKTESDIND